MRRWWAAVAVAGLLATGLVTPAAADDRAGPPPQLRREGRWLVDDLGRVVIVHGVNLVYKRKPYVPPSTAGGFRARDARWLRRHGFNAARVGTLWAGLTPEAPGRADRSYLRRWQRVLDLLAGQRIWIQLDAHQDMWHETYGGEGVPDWAMVRPAPYHLLPPVKAPFPLGYWTPETSAVFDEFWANKHGLLDGWVAAWRVAAREWRDQPYLMGYDLLNEPWMGMEWPDCLVAGCRGSYRRELQPAMERATRAIRRIDRRNIVWWEPQQFAGGQRVDTYFTAPSLGGRREPQLGLSWHSYCPEVFYASMGLPIGNVEKCWSYARNRQRHALDQARRMRAAPMMSEWGATDDVRALAIDAAVADEFLMGWTHWAYKRWNDPTTADDAQGMFRDDRRLSTVKRAKVRALVRTYAQATAGTPLEMRFDTGTGAFRYRYRPDPSIEAPTEIFVSPLHYPRGWRVRVTHGSAVKRGKTRLLVTADGSRPVTVRVVRR